MLVFDRARSLNRLADETFDVVVVGGGITGVGCALDAVSRGLRTALIERDDFSSGTSSKSSKLVHGGLRYLQQGEVRLVYEALAERQVLRKTAPHLVRILPFLLPMFTGKDGLINPKLARTLGTAMWMYDLTGGARIGKLHQRISTDEAVDYVPTLRRERLAPSYLYYDARADDSRLTLAVARTAAALGAAVANRSALVRIDKDGAGSVTAAVVRADGAEIAVRTRTIVNATGVWADDVRALDEAQHPSTIRPAKGVHLTVPWSKVRNRIGAVIPVPKDKRSIFVVPWGDTGNGEFQFTYIGTTDTDYDGPLEDPPCTRDDVDYCLAALNHAIDTPVRDDEVLGVWSGLRPLVKSAASGRTADLSRRHSVNMTPSGVVTVTGGKLTTYRRMAADTIDDVMDRLGRKGSSRTKHLMLVGADGWDRSGASEHLASRYGSEAPAVLRLVEQDPSLGEPLVPGLPYLRAEAIHSVRAEMATTLDDVLSRRTRARILARDATASAAGAVAALIGPELGWSADAQAAAAAAYANELAAERDAGGLPETALDALAGA